MMMIWKQRLQQRQSKKRIAELLLVTVGFVELDGLKKMTWLHYYGRFIVQAMQCIYVGMNALRIRIDDEEKKKRVRADRRKGGLFYRAVGPPSSAIFFPQKKF